MTASAVVRKKEKVGQTSFLGRREEGFIMATDKREEV